MLRKIRAFAIITTCSKEYDNKKLVSKMQTPTRNNYLTNFAWFQETIGGKELILCHTSALECLELFTGYFHEKEIDVYAREKGDYENINYQIVDSFDGIEFVRMDNILCTSVNQTFNDMLSKYGTIDENTIDEQSLLEGLSKYYFLHNESFENLYILPENKTQFEKLKKWAVEYYDES